MKKINWKQKLSSRKLWAAVAGLAVSIMIIFGADSESQERITGVITATSTLVCYILSEGSVDKANASVSDNSDD